MRKVLSLLMVFLFIVIVAEVWYYFSLADKKSPASIPTNLLTSNTSSTTIEWRPWQIENVSHTTLSTKTGIIPVVDATLKFIVADPKGFFTAEEKDGQILKFYNSQYTVFFRQKTQAGQPILEKINAEPPLVKGQLIKLRWYDDPADKQPFPIWELTVEK